MALAHSTARAIDDRRTEPATSSSETGRLQGTAAPLARVLALAATAVAVFLPFGPLGTNITDEGLVVDWAYRILHGAVPHRDIISPRPLGSALIHVVDVLQPFPVLITSRFISVAEVVAYSALFASIVYRAPFRRWGVGHLAGVLAASLINLHTFPLGSWYTIDGILLSAIAARLMLPIRPLPSWRVALAMGCCGLAVAVKQSFALVPVLGLAAVWLAEARSQRRRLRQIALAAAAAAAPLFLYAAWVTAAGGLTDMARQFVHAGGIDWLVFLSAYGDPSSRALLLVLLASTALSFSLLATARRLGPERVAPFWFIGLFLGTAVVVIPVATDQLSNYGAWGLTLEWTMAVALLMEFGVAGAVSPPGLWLVVTAFMVQLSFGYRNPNLVAGSLALFLLHSLWTAPVTAELISTSLSRRSVALLLRTPLVILCLTLLVSGYAYRTRTTQIYRELPARHLTASADRSSDAYRFIRVDPATAEYFGQIRDCVERYPARRVSVVPDTPTTYVAFKHEPALPISLVQPYEYLGAHRQLRDAVRRLDERGDYLVLVQTWAGISTGAGSYTDDRLPVATLDTQPQEENGGAYFLDLIASLTGERHACGSLIAIHKPAPSS